MYKQARRDLVEGGRDNAISLVHSEILQRRYRPMLGRPRRRSSITVSANDPHPLECRRHSRTEPEEEEEEDDEREIRYVHIFRGPT